ncbi:hypothetical protein RCD17_26195 [Klebsiella pneumoniae]|nr:hypothetical protein [Klebsiella pneumoniae]
MTDITELAQSLKAEDISSERMEWLKKLADMEYCASNPGHWLMNLRETNYLASLALQCLESNSTLVEALEKAQQQTTESENRVRKQNRHICELFDDNTALRKRIAELESRTVTVKLASRRLPSDYVDGEFGNDDLAAIHNACRLECKVSVEKYLSAHGIVVKWEDE